MIISDVSPAQQLTLGQRIRLSADRFVLVTLVSSTPFQFVTQAGKTITVSSPDVVDGLYRYQNWIRSGYLTLTTQAIVSYRLDEHAAQPVVVDYYHDDDEYFDPAVPFLGGLLLGVLLG